jgi:hypothetical protein
VEPDRSRHEVGELQPHGVRALVRDHDVEWQPMSMGVLPVARSPEGAIELPIFADTARLEHDMRRRGRFAVPAQSFVEPFEAKTETLVVQMLDRGS